MYSKAEYIPDAAIPGPAAYVFGARDGARRRQPAPTGSGWLPFSLGWRRMRAADGTVAPDDLGWGRFCSRLAVVPVEGDHYSMIGPAARRKLAEALLSVAQA